MSATAIRSEQDLLQIDVVDRDLPQPEELPESAAPLTHTLPGFEVSLPTGEQVVHASAAEFAQAILDGQLPRRARARRTPSDGTAAGPWSTVEQVALADVDCRAAYQPVWHHTLRFMGYGAIAGVGLKLLDTTVTFFSVGEGLGWVWLIVLGSLALSSRWSMAPAAGIYVSIKAGVGGLFMAALTAGIVGLAFGIPIGALIGTLVGHSRRHQATLAPDAAPEGTRPYVLGLIVPALYLCLAVPAYVWFNLWLIARLSQ